MNGHQHCIVAISEPKSSPLYSILAITHAIILTIIINFTSHSYLFVELPDTAAAAAAAAAAVAAAAAAAAAAAYAATAAAGR